MAHFPHACAFEMVSCEYDEQIRIVLASLSDLIRFLFVDGRLQNTIRCCISKICNLLRHINTMHQVGKTLID